MCHLSDNVEKHGRGGQATDDNTMWHMCCVYQITKTYKHTLRVRNN